MGHIEQITKVESFNGDISSFNKVSPILEVVLNDKNRKKYGLCVIFDTKDKHPGIKNWQNHAKEGQTEEDIRNLYMKRRTQYTAYSYFTGIGGLIDIDFDSPWMYYEAEKYFGARFNTMTLKTPNGGFRVLFRTDKPEDFFKYKDIQPKVEIHGKSSHHVVVYGNVLNDKGQLKQYEIVKDTDILHDSTIIKDFKEFLHDKVQLCYFLQYPCIKNSVLRKKNELTQEQRTSIGSFFAVENIDIDLATGFFSCTDDFQWNVTKEHLKRLYQKNFKHPKCETLKEHFNVSKKDCNLCGRIQSLPSSKKLTQTVDRCSSEVELPILGWDEFLEKTNNPIQKLRHGLGYNPVLGLTYIGSYTEAGCGYYGISLENPIRAVYESNDVNSGFAEDLHILSGFTDPLTDKTLQQIRLLAEEQYITHKIRYHSLSSLVENMIAKSSHYLDFPGEMDRLMFVLWNIGTYLRPLFIWYPYLCFEGLRDVGKSTALEFQALTCFNGGGNVSGGYTEADLHKSAASTMGYFAIDHLEERLKSPEKTQFLNEFLENAWKLKSYVSKRDQTTGKPLKLPLACSVAMGTRRTTESIAEKGLIIQMKETNNNQLRHRSVTMYKDKYFQNIERELIAMSLQYQDKIKTEYESIPVISGLGREFNKFLPLFALSKVIDEETNGKTEYYSEITQFASEYRKNRKSEREDTEEILLRLILQEKVLKTTYQNLAELMFEEGYDKYRWQTAQSDIKKLGVIKNINRKKSPVEITIDLGRAQERANSRGITIDMGEKTDDELVLSDNSSAVEGG